MSTDSPYPYFSTTPPQIYRQYFTAEECRTLDSCPLESALSEIGLLRVLLLRLLAASRASELSGDWASSPRRRYRAQGGAARATIAHAGPSPDQRRRRLSLARQMSILGAFSSTGLIMASLVRFHNRYVEPPHSLLELLSDMDPDDL